MSIDERTAARIDDYLNNQLSESERKKFESELKNNPDLADELRIQENLLQIIGERGIVFSKSSFSREAIDEVANFLSGDEMVQIRKDIREINDQYNGKTNKSRTLFYQISGIAASVLILIALGLSLFLNNNDDLYGKYKDKYLPVSMVERSESGTTLSIVEKSFNEGQYNEVVSITSAGDELKFKYPIILLYQGIAYRELGDYVNALQSFSEFGLISDLDTDLMHWHKGLVYLKSDNPKKAKETFSKIDLNGNFKGAEDVKEILNSLK